MALGAGLVAPRRAPAGYFGVGSSHPQCPRVDSLHPMLASFSFPFHVPSVETLAGLKGTALSRPPTLALTRGSPPRVCRAVPGGAPV